MSKTVMRSLLCAAALAAILGQSGCVTAPGPAPTEMAVANAKTKSDHEAIAAGYEKAAAAATEVSRKHRVLAKSYHGMTVGRGEGGHGMASHCEKLADLYQKAAQENLELAKLHKETAADMK